MSGGWADSNRRNELPADWYTGIRPAILERDGHRCQACGDHATDVDHIGDKHDHRPDNLQALCGWCHKRKTSAQGNQSPNRQQITETRQREQHPGLM
ncbi:HNH endonuclease [Streptomyces europaeiscabiei]|uniref:HNH endonuclease n=1 Tax=Streptomyces europaeiscabiei TaxID=146819 RepID=UPI0029B04650|nr:HNH endonuclease signature motif containing protein [Streptomyces europaeiscabiei]MDX2528043.1 HNH endonuclease signature motif containing protein [Streptomyces europaeiscabiei]MDX3713387.1 HNH endonuclease signature motif containing protein [Streptomyces europaeiscabiei]